MDTGQIMSAFDKQEAIKARMRRNAIEENDTICVSLRREIRRLRNADDPDTLAIGDAKNKLFKRQKELGIYGL